MDGGSERNLQPAQRLAVVEKFKAKIQEEAKERQSEYHGNQYEDVDSSPNGEKCKVHTDKELAKLAGVGTGTVARYNKVMKSDVVSIEYNHTDSMKGAIYIWANKRKRKLFFQKKLTVP